MDHYEIWKGRLAIMAEAPCCSAETGSRSWGELSKVKGKVESVSCCGQDDYLKETLVILAFCPDQDPTAGV